MYRYYILPSIVGGIFSFLANMCYQRITSLQFMLACKTIKEITYLLEVSATPYWQMRSHFGAESKTGTKRLSTERLNLIVINAVVPMLFAYGRSKAKEVYCDRAFDFIEQCKAEKNAITKHSCLASVLRPSGEQYGIKAETACDSQALIQLQREYCDKRQCLRCRFGLLHHQFLYQRHIPRLHLFCRRSMGTREME